MSFQEKIKQKAKMMNDDSFPSCWGLMVKLDDVLAVYAEWLEAKIDKNIIELIRERTEPMYACGLDYDMNITTKVMQTPNVLEIFLKLEEERKQKLQQFPVLKDSSHRGYVAFYAEALAWKKEFLEP